MQRATRSSFRQKGAEIQKIDQSGTWAIIASYWLNPEWDPQKCEDDYKKKYGDNFVSLAKWVYSCKRVIRKSDHRVVRLPNGEILSPCYYVEPSRDKVFPVGRLVWLEPLPQLNGFLIVEEGGESNIKACPEQGYGSDYGDGYGGYGYGGYGSSIGGSEGQGISCLECLSRLCVVRNSYGAITDIFYVLDDGTRIPIGDCYSDSGGSGGGGGRCGGLVECCFHELGTPYTAVYNLTINGNSYSGSLYTTAQESVVTFAGDLNGPFCDEEYQMPMELLELSLVCNTDFCLEIFFTVVCGAFTVCDLRASDFDISYTGCPNNPTYVLTIKPGRCASGTIVVAPS